MLPPEFVIWLCAILVASPLRKSVPVLKLDLVLIELTHVWLIQ